MVQACPKPDSSGDLIARLEYRHDHITGTGGDPFNEHSEGFCLSGGCTSDIDVALLEVSYQFD